MTKQDSSGKTAVYTGYQIWSDTYDAQVNPTRDLSTAVMLKLAPPVKNKFVVEAGCGTGVNTVWLAEVAKQLIALDFSDGMLAQAQRKVTADHVRFEQHDLTQPWPVADGVADLVLINLVIEHIANLEAVLAQAWRVLGENGRLLITEYHPNRVKGGNGAQIEKDGKIIVEISNHWHPIDEYHQLGKKLGFASVQVQEWAEHLDENGQPVETAVSPQLISVLMQK